MKLPIQQLSQHLTKNMLPIYLISGDEPLLVQEAQDLIRSAAKQKGFAERIRLSIEPGADWGKLLQSEAQSLSLFSTQRLLELDLNNIKFNTASSKILQDYAANPPSDTVLLISIHKLDSKSEQSSWYKALDKISAIIPVWPVTLEQLPAWILHRAKNLNLTLTQAAANFLATQVEGNLLAAAQELEKLRLFQPNSPIDQTIIEKMIADHAHFDIFSLVDSVLIGNMSRSLRILNNLNAEGIEPTLILWALARELRTLAELAKKTQQGTALSTLFSQFRIWEKRQGCVRAFLKRHKKENCWKFLNTAAQIDRMIKGAELGNSWDSLEQFVVQLAG